MKRFFALMAAALVATPAHALFGVGDLTFDPTTYGEVAKQYEQMVKMYNTAKEQLDGLVKIERTIKEAQQAVDTLSSGGIRQSIQGITGTSTVKSAADLRAEVANIESRGNQSAGFIQYQMSLIKQLDDLAALQQASAGNAKEATGKNSTATNTAITAQSSATVAALAAAEEARRVRDDSDRAAAAKAAADNLKDSKKIYKAMAK